MNQSTTHDADPVLPGPLPPDHVALSVAKYPGQERYQVWVSVDGHEIVEISAYRTRAAADAARQRIADHRAKLAISPAIVTQQDVVDALVPLYQSERAAGDFPPRPFPRSVLQRLRQHMAGDQGNTGPNSAA